MKTASTAIRTLKNPGHSKMLIIGTTELTFKREKGSFFCPLCRADAFFQRRIKRRFLTLYFIPILPFEKTADFVECLKCRNKCDPDILDRDPNEVLQSLHANAMEHVLRVMILTMIADERITAEEIDVVQKFFERSGGGRLTPQQIDAESVIARESEVTAAVYAGIVADELSDAEAEQMVKGAFLVASASGSLTDSQLEDLKLLPLALGIDEQRYCQIIAFAIDAEDD